MWVSSSAVTLLEIQGSDDYCADNGWDKHTDKESNSPHIGGIHIPLSPVNIDPDSAKQPNENSQHSGDLNPDHVSQNNVCGRINPHFLVRYMSTTAPTCTMNADTDSGGVPCPLSLFDPSVSRQWHSCRALSVQLVGLEPSYRSAIGAPSNQESTENQQHAESTPEGSERESLNCRASVVQRRREGGEYSAVGD